MAVVTGVQMGTLCFQWVEVGPHSVVSGEHSQASVQRPLLYSKEGQSLTVLCPARPRRCVPAPLVPAPVPPAHQEDGLELVAAGWRHCVLLLPWGAGLLVSAQQRIEERDSEMASKQQVYSKINSDSLLQREGSPKLGV